MSELTVGEVTPVCPWCSLPLSKSRGGYECGSGWNIHHELKQSYVCKHIVSQAAEVKRLRRELNGRNVALDMERAKLYEIMKERDRLRRERDVLAGALTEARQTLAVAIEAGLPGFNEDEVAKIIAEHSTIRRIDSALRAPGGGGE